MIERNTPNLIHILFGGIHFDFDSPYSVDECISRIETISLAFSHGRKKKKKLIFSTVDENIYSYFFDSFEIPRTVITYTGIIEGFDSHTHIEGHAKIGLGIRIGIIYSLVFAFVFLKVLLPISVFVLIFGLTWSYFSALDCRNAPNTLFEILN